MSLDQIKEQIKKDVEDLSFNDKVNYINDLRYTIHILSPFKNEPVDYVKWVVNEDVVANDYNPNKVAPPEMELLEVSIMNDGYTQPIVSWSNPDKGKTEVIDGFHRNRVGKESKVVNQRVKGYLPIVDIRKEQSGKNDRIASTIRHNRARGKHQVNAMSEIVIELKNRNWTNKRISKQLGMDEEEVLRLCQISGLEHLFSDSDFSNAWESEDVVHEYVNITNFVTEEQMSLWRIPNENDKTRIYHTYDKWECHKAGFYANSKEGLTHEECEDEFARILSDKILFAEILDKLIIEWKYSCEHYLTNKSMNRIAWLGQAAVCFHSGIPARYSSAWFNIPYNLQLEANLVAVKYLNIWLERNGLEKVDVQKELKLERQVDLY
jgi:ParB-like chromosome segregation protein Spo0J